MQQTDLVDITIKNEFDAKTNADKYANANLQENGDEIAQPLAPSQQQPYTVNINYIENQFVNFPNEGG